MTSSSFLFESLSAVVADTSVIINLIGTRYAADILRAFPSELVLVDAVKEDIERGRRRGREDADALRRLLSSRLLRVVSLNDLATSLFEQLIAGAAADTLDDGEAATIAYAVHSGTVALIDERKAHRLCAQRLPSLTVGTTIDLLAEPSISRALGHERLSEAVFNAFQVARMSILPRDEAWVEGILSPKRITLCGSLPRSMRLRAASKL
jgi:predicted nucleic acid-binding protein